jgi:SAM-dependent methyltransferase
MKMSEPRLQSQIDAARAYEAVFVPALLAQWVSKVADAAQIRRGQRVLDVGCGTGVLTREIASRLGSTGGVVGIDPNPGMLAVAAEGATAAEWRDGIAESLLFDDRSFDAVVSQFALMFFRDRGRGLREMLRVLRPGGRLAVAVWNSLDSMPAFADEVALLERLGGRSAADALRAPFVLGNPDQLTTLFSDAGAAAVEITSHRGIAQFATIRTLVEADLRGWLPVMGVMLSEDQINRILVAADQALAPYASADGQAVFEISALIVGAQKA